MHAWMSTAKEANVTQTAVPRCRAYSEIKEDMKDEADKHGRCLTVVIPRPGAGGAPDEPYCGKVVLEFEDANVAMRARNALHGRKFGGNEVVAAFLPEHLYTQGQYTT